MLMGYADVLITSTNIIKLNTFKYTNLCVIEYHMSNFRVQYITDEYTEDVEKKCDHCNGLCVCVTKCCNIKLCQFHYRLGEEELGNYMSCCSCQTYVNLDLVSPAGYIITHNNVYCKKHNVLTICEKCEGIYYCTDHINTHQCVEYIEYVK